MILTTIIPLKPYVGALFIPRDLWVPVPGHGENRINTAHFFAESETAGSGPYAAMNVVHDDFGVNVDYYVRLRFTGFKDAVDAIGGVDVEFPEGTSGYSPGVHHLNGEEALALVRDRSGDDFFRQQRGMIFLRSLYKTMARPENWRLLPAVASELAKAIDTNLPVWQWPRLGLALLRAGADGIDFRSISREMVNPFTTNEGAQVLAPNWSQINPVLLEMFGE
jgi:LCP family protein required for cell wall assembly